MLRYVFVLTLVACGSSSSSRSRDTAGGDAAEAQSAALTCVDRECTDPATGLVWVAAVDLVDDGAAHCEALTTANHDDYRVPTLDEALALPRADGELQCQLPCRAKDCRCSAEPPDPTTTSWVLGAPSIDDVWTPNSWGQLWVIGGSGVHSQPQNGPYPAVCVRP